MGAGAAGAGATRVWPPVPGPLTGAPIALLRHPAEPSRFALALVALAVAAAVAVFVLVSLGQATVLLAIVLGIAGAVLLIWVLVQIWRIRLLGDAVLVSERTLPEVQAVVDVVRGRLSYSRRVDLFVVDKISRVLSADDAPISLTTYFGVHVLVAEGDALGDPGDPDEREQLLFTLATYVGALKARYGQWWSPIFTAFQMTGLTVFVAPFVLPYHRATVFSGDRIAYACCGDLEVSLQAVYRALVGTTVAPHLRADGLTAQALQARRRPLLRFAQLLRPTPHATSRYLELLSFVRLWTPAAFAAHRPPLAGADPEAERVLTALARRRAHPAVVLVGIALAGAALVGGLVLGAVFRDSAVARGIVEAVEAGEDGGGEGTGGGAPVPTEEELLLALLPPDLRAGCAAGGADPAAGLVASIECPLGGNRPDGLTLFAFESAPAMGDAFEAFVGDLPAGDCAIGNARNTWVLEGVTQGPLGCYESSAGDTTILWGSAANAVLALAQDATWSPSVMYRWWTTDAPTLR
ncbi:hypothetical protein D0Z06_12310 [Geodermatophilus marinus]|nr:hypothetical protein D0Z06_12310 [Geodermatophilus sp. LHW52908]